MALTTRSTTSAAVAGSGCDDSSPGSPRATSARTQANAATVGMTKAGRHQRRRPREYRTRPPPRPAGVVCSDVSAGTAGSSAARRVSSAAQ